MLDQNITTLLAALIGGLLSALGGFLANYYIQSSSDKISKKKEIRNMLEKVYKNTQAVETACIRIETKLGMSETERDKVFQEIDASLSSLELLVDFYLPPLKTDFSEYKEKVLKLLATRQDLAELGTTTTKLRSSVVELFKKEGYSYL